VVPILAYFNAQGEAQRQALVADKMALLQPEEAEQWEDEDDCWPVSVSWKFR
jgi:hypothetical protein